MRNVGLFICMLFTFVCSAQSLSFGLGFAVNQTRLRQKAPTVDADFSNPHNAGIGISAHSVASLKFGEKYSVCLRPGLSVLGTRSDVTNDNLFAFLNVATGFGYAIKNRFLIA